MTDWTKYPNFTAPEMDDGGPESPDVFMYRLQLARSICTQMCRDRGYPEVSFNITSGSRSETRNRQVGGKPDSTHLYGRACDIEAVSSRHRFLIVKSLMLAGFTRIGLSKAGLFVHVDDGEHIDGLNKDPDVLWLY